MRTYPPPNEEKKVRIHLWLCVALETQNVQFCVKFSCITYNYVNRKSTCEYATHFFFKITKTRGERNQEIHTFSFGNTRKYQEITKNFRKYL
jgi:hypothetical protein